MRIGTIVGVSCAVCAAAGEPALAAVTAAPGYLVRTIAAPDTVQGGVVRHGDQLMVGQGPTFTGGAQRVVRFAEGGPATTIAEGFNSLGGFDVGPGGTLYLVDNGLEATGATSGDTVYAVPDAPARTTALAAAAAELLPAGSIDAAYDALVVPDAVLVSDATGPGAGRVVRVAGGVASTLLAGLDYTAGLALDGATLLVGNSSADFVGSVRRFDLGGTPDGTRVDGLSGNSAHVVDDDGAVLVSGGFTPDFASSTVVAVDAAGAVTERARGFAFSGEMFFDAVRNETLVLDFGVPEITAICRDADGDGTCDADQPCGRDAAKAKLTVKKLDGERGDERLFFAGRIAVGRALQPALDPVRRGVRLRLETAGGAAIDAVVPPGAFDADGGTGWKANKARTGWTYTGAAGVGPLGVSKVILKTKSKLPGVVKFAVRGAGARLAIGPGDAPLRATLALDASGQCGVADFAGPERRCGFNRKLSTVVCK